MPEPTDNRRKRQTSEAYKAWRRRYRAKNKDAIKIASNLDLPIAKARAVIAEAAR